MRSHLAQSTVAISMFAALFARVPAAYAQVRGMYAPGTNATRSAPPEAGIVYGVIVIIPVAVMPLTKITFGKMAGAAPLADSSDAPAALGWRSDRQDAGRLRPSGTGGPTVYLTRYCRPAQPVPGECTNSGTNVIWSATGRYR